MRALSDRWVYQQKYQNWGRKKLHRCHSDGSEGGNLADTTVPTSLKPVLISELHGSLTDLTREVKTYSFCPVGETYPSCPVEETHPSCPMEDPEQLPPIVVDPPGTTQYASTSTPSPTKTYPSFSSSPPLPTMDNSEGEGEGEGERDVVAVLQSGLSFDSEADSEIFDPKLDIFDEGESFASGLCTVFDSSMQKLRTGDHRSHSLPNVFTLGHEVIDTSCISTTTTDENTSTSVSVASLLGDSSLGLDEPPIERISTPDRLVMTAVSCVTRQQENLQQKHYGRTSSATTLPSSFTMSTTGGGLSNSSAVATHPKRWSGPGHYTMGGYESGSDIGEMDREQKTGLSPLVDGDWMSRSYAHPLRKRSPDSPSEEAEPANLRRRKKRGGGKRG